MSGGNAQVLKDVMNSTFSSDITPDTIAKLERERSHLELEMYADACVKSMKQEYLSYGVWDNFEQLTQELDRLKRQPSKLKRLSERDRNITKEIQQKANVARSIREAKSILESKKEELDEIKEEFDEKIEIINKIRAIEGQEFQIYTDDELDAMNKDTLQGEIDARFL
ncbi:18772_t:CDS:2 [Funneliformis geosporum]|uniref:18772_t:CDS:1 n=1 Tax=Funneliformis geosporum TaxID=1117311 RepID=A0A9W4SIP5_9GLOM|nr:18772_t:CDS:2 [Funneliformis geosporum]